MDDVQTDAERNGMTEAEWLSLPEAARAWRRDHPRPEHAPPQVDAHQFDTAQGHAAEPAPEPPRGPQGGQTVLTGAAQAAARGELHGSIEHNTAARDKALEVVHAVEAGAGSLLHRAEDALHAGEDRVESALQSGRLAREQAARDAAKD
jgi:hypothetical protein